ncbi:MAG: biotin/lipoyl-binding protein [Alphaproteobacteria bacterium]|nr:biotin/lipoyl-binding protein [Alphaproteobacteria bacterium]
MTIKKLLIANRGEIAIRIARASGELGIPTVMVHSADDKASLHTRAGDETRTLKGSGVHAYLDIAGVIAVAKEAGADAIHPGYGFLSENAAFAQACSDAGIKFVGPTAEQLDLFGDKVRARELAERCNVPVLPASGVVDVAGAHAFFDELGANAAIMIKAVAGGGGRGARAVEKRAEIAEAFKRCESEAKAAFGNGALFAERLIRRARHFEVQIIGDGSDVAHLNERECTIQRRHQKLIEIAPSPTLTAELRAKITEAAVKIARGTKYQSLGTFEFLVDADSGEFFFIEANPRLQVEHTVTEEVTGVDLVMTQLRIAGGAALSSLQVENTPRGFAIQMRINAETIDARGQTKPSTGTLTAFEPPSGPGVRVDTYGYAGYTTNPSFDSLLAKLIVHSRSLRFQDTARRAARALSEFRIAGVATNAAFLEKIVTHPDFIAGRATTRFVDEHAAVLAGPAASPAKRFFEPAQGAAPATQRRATVPAPEGTVAVPSPMQGRVVSIDVREGDTVHAGQQLAVLEAMKMEHLINAQTGGIVRLIAAEKDQTLFEGDAILFVEPSAVGERAAQQAEEIDLDAIRPDLAEVIERHAIGLDERRPDAVARRRKTNQRTARENVEDLVDRGSFIEYGALALAAQRRRRTMDELMKISPADGLIAGVGSINGALFGDEQSRAMVMAYDYTVFAGTQGATNHKKKDRLLRIASDWRLPVVIFAEGGGGRPGDTDSLGVAGLDVPTFATFAKLSGLVPLVGIVSGRCYAGNAALLGCCDVIIATKNANIGMGGPAMIEGGGLGVYAPEDIGPIDVQRKNGVVDVVVEDEIEAVRVAKQYLSYMQGAVEKWDAADQRHLRRLIPENRLRVYDIRNVIDALADTDSVLELRRDFAIGMITAFIRIEGRPFGLIANNPLHLSGAIDAVGADKAARFMQLCDAFGLPILSLCDTPGFMVGPEVEEQAQVRHTSRMFVVGANLSVPVFTVVVRKGYGLGAQSMCAGSFHQPFFIVAWPTGEFGGMGLEGAVRLGYRKELEAVNDPAERDALFKKLVARLYEVGKGVSMAAWLEIDDVIDPAETRRWIMRGLRSVPPPEKPQGKRRPFIDAW